MIKILLVDDGSPDNAGAICDEYATKDSRIRVFHIPNGGVAKARQLGVENSTGDYIVFVDPDDWLPFDSVEVLYSNMSDKVDLVIGGYIRHENNDIKEYVVRDQIMDRYSYIKFLFKGSFFSGSPWAKLYRINLFKDMDFPSSKKSQDFLMNMKLSSKITNIKIIHSVVYNYNILQSSTTCSHKRSYLEAKQYCNILRDILIEGEIFDKYIVDYNHCVFTSISAVLRRGYAIDTQDKLIVDMASIIKFQMISNKEKILLLGMMNRFVQLFIRLLIKVRNSQRLLVLYISNL